MGSALLRRVIINNVAPPTGDYTVTFYDYYGNVAKTQSVNSGEDATPPVLSDPNLDLQEWQGDSYTNVTSDRKCFAIGITKDGKWHFDIILTSLTGLEIPVCFTNTDETTLYIDKGDGSEVLEITDTSVQNTVLVYTNYGKYTIKIWKLEGVFNPSGDTSSTVCIGGSSQTARNSLVEVRGGGSITHISSYAFSNNNLINITLPNSILSIGNNVFASCFNLESLILPNGVSSIGTNLCYNCYRLTRFVISASITSVSSGMLYLCYSVADIKIPDNVTSISNNTFQSCFSLTNINIPEGVTVIGSSAFADCRHLKKVNIPNKVKSISTFTFQNCYNLTSIDIHSNVTSISGSAFQNCYGVRKIILRRNTPPSLSNINAFGGINPTCKMYVPDESVGAYKTATNWVTYADYIYPMSELED